MNTRGPSEAEKAKAKDALTWLSAILANEMDISGPSAMNLMLCYGVKMLSILDREATAEILAALESECRTGQPDGARYQTAFDRLVAAHQRMFDGVTMQ